MTRQLRIRFVDDPGLDTAITDLSRDLQTAGLAVDVLESRDVEAKGVELITAIGIGLAAIKTVRPIILRVIAYWIQRPRRRKIVIEVVGSDKIQSVVVDSAGLSEADFAETMSSIDKLLG